MRYSDIAEKLANQAEAVCKELLPNGSIVGNKYCIGDIHGNKGQSLKINLFGSKCGKWYEFNGGQHGDLIDLWAHCKNLELSDAYNEACEWLGVESPNFASKVKNYLRPQLPEGFDQKLNHLTYLESERAIPQTIIKKFRAKETETEILFYYFRDGELINIKTLPKKRQPDGKKFAARFERGCEQTLYGWDASTTRGKSITLCEGEIDAMSLAAYGINALSVPTGAMGTRWIENDFDRLSKYDVIYLCFDNDETGQAGALAHAQRLGLERCYNVRLPLKDANECLVKKIPFEKIKECFLSSKSFDPHQLDSPSSFRDKVMERIFPSDGTNLGYDSPWAKFNDKIFFDQSGLSVWTGINGHGKTQFLNHLACYWMSKNAKVCIASLELDPDETLQNLISVLSGKNTNPRLEGLISRDYVRTCINWLENDRLWFYNEFGGTKAKSLVEVLQYAHRKYGLDVFIIDSLSLIDIDDDDYNSQANFVRELVKFKKNNNCHIHLVVHPRKGADENQNPGKFDFKGSGTITNLADNCFSVSRNKLKEEARDLNDMNERLSPEEEKRLNQPDCYVWCMKQRKGGHEGKFGFWLDLTAKQYLAHESAKARPFVPYSNC